MERCFDLLLAWPQELDLSAFESGSLEHAAALIRRNQLCAAEVVLLSTQSRVNQGSWDNTALLALLAQIRLIQGSLSACELLIQRIYSLASDSWIYRWLYAQLLIQQGRFQEVACLSSDFWRDENCYPLLAFVHVAERLANNDLQSAEHLLLNAPASSCLESLRLNAALLKARGDSASAFDLLQPLLTFAPESILLQSQVFELVIAARRIPQIVPIAREALLKHGEHPELLNNVTAVKLFQRQPSYARRCALTLQLWASLGRSKAGMPNLICSYEQCGNADWLEYLHPAIWRQPLVNTDLSGNLVLHLASMQSHRHKEHLSNFVTALQSSPAQQILCKAPPSSLEMSAPMTNDLLRIAWVSPDFTPHPVSRFLMHFFQASRGMLSHQHHLISLQDHGSQSNLSSFQEIPGLQLIDVSRLQPVDRVSAIREIGADLVVDLAGWTGGHFAAGFLARLAKVQINYLGYFATSGLPTMDYWLGDHALFPDGHSEWCTERLWRLPRPFIAWQPPLGLPEAGVHVTDPPVGPIRFGSFNNNRKLSDRTIQLWSQILLAIPDSRLVLKANSAEDPYTQELLARRMRRYGLDPQRVDWLELTAGCKEHLLQYRHMDVALDPVPNGGCTTTCEALWMGCPVITMAGSHYVSRMSTAVLSGAGLFEWIAESEQSYVRLAIQQAMNVHWLRQNRSRWRHSLVSSPIGNAADLMRELETAFSAMLHLSAKH